MSNKDYPPTATKEPTSAEILAGLPGIAEREKQAIAAIEAEDIDSADVAENKPDPKKNEEVKIPPVELNSPASPVFEPAEPIESPAAALIRKRREYEEERRRKQAEPTPEDEEIARLKALLEQMLAKQNQPKEEVIQNPEPVIEHATTIEAGKQKDPEERIEELTQQYRQIQQELKDTPTWKVLAVYKLEKALKKVEKEGMQLRAMLNQRNAEGKTKE